MTPLPGQIVCLKIYFSPNGFPLSSCVHDFTEALRVTKVLNGVHYYMTAMINKSKTVPNYSIKQPLKP